MQTINTPTDYKQALLNRYKKDLAAAKNFCSLCRKSIKEAHQKRDEETVYFWAHQQDAALQNIQAINSQLNSL